MAAALMRNEEIGESMMKKFCAFLLCAALVLGMAGCGKSNAEGDSFVPPESKGVASEVSESSSVAAGQEAPPVKARSADTKVENHSVKAIKERGTLVIALVENNAPFAFFNDVLDRQGLDSSLSTIIAEDMGVELELFSGTPEEVADAVRTGRADIALGGFAAGDAVLRGVLETNVYAGGKQVLVCCIEDVRLYATIDSLATKTIACLKRQPEQAKIVKELLPSCATKQVESVDVGVQKVRSGTCVALMLDEFQATAYTQDAVDIAISSVPLTTETLVQPKVMAVMKDNEDLAAFLNQTIIKTYTVSGGLGRLMISATTKANHLDLLDEA